MKAPQLFFRTILLTSAFLAIAARGEDSLRLVVIEVAPKEATAIRLELGDAAKGAKVEAIDAVLKRKGITCWGISRRAIRGPGGRWRWPSAAVR